MGRACAAFCLVALAASTALAQPHEPQRGWYGGLAIGRSESTQYCSPSVQCDDHATALRLLAGFQYSRYFALELGYNHLGLLSTVYGQAPRRTWTVDLTSMLSLNIGSFSLYGRSGPYITDEDIAPTAALGVAYRASREMTWRAEYQHFFDLGIFSGLEVQLFTAGARWSF